MLTEANTAPGKNQICQEIGSYKFNEKNHDFDRKCGIYQYEYRNTTAGTDTDYVAVALDNETGMWEVVHVESYNRFIGSSDTYLGTYDDWRSAFKAVYGWIMTNPGVNTPGPRTKAIR